jgi:hypothetical protein
MSAKSAYLAAELLKWVTGQTNDLGTAVTPYLGMLSALSAPGEAGTEVTGDGYARLDTSGDWGAPSAGTGNKRRVANSADLTMATMTANKTVVGIGIWDAASGGNLLYSKSLGISVTVPANNPAVWATGDVVIEED